MQARELLNKGCAACQLRPGCLQVVVADGSPEAELVIIGEGPGGDEDREGRPFVGRGGQLLDQILNAAGIARTETYITNIVKCRPPGNRTPEAVEIETCTALWLEPQLRALRPRIIISLGNTPTQYLLGTAQGVSKLRGQWFQYRHDDGQGGHYEAYLMPMYHPAYLLRKDTRTVGGPKSLTWRDIREVAAVLRREKEPDTFAQLVPEGMQGQPGLF